MAKEINKDTKVKIASGTFKGKTGVVSEILTDDRFLITPDPADGAPPDWIKWFKSELEVI